MYDHSFFYKKQVREKKYFYIKIFPKTDESN